MENKNKNVIIIVLGAVIVLVLGLLIGGAGKGTSSNGGNSSSDGGSSQVDPAPQMSDDDLFIASLRSQGNSYIDNADDYQLIAAGQAVCDALDAGNSMYDIIQYLAANGDTNDQEFYAMEGLVIGSAVSVYCPEYMDLIP